MRQRIENTLTIGVSGYDMSTARNIEIYIKQGNDIFLSYVPTETSATDIVFTLPYADAMELKPCEAAIQIAFTDADDKPRASDVAIVHIGELLKEAGYVVQN